MAAPLQAGMTKIGEYYPAICRNHHMTCKSKLVNDAFHLNTFYLKIRAISEQHIQVSVCHYQIKNVNVGLEKVLDVIVGDKYEDRLFTFEKKPKISDKNIVALFNNVQGEQIPNEVLEELSLKLQTHYANEIK